jgi:hypothetical protein
VITRIAQQKSVWGSPHALFDPVSVLPFDRQRKLPRIVRCGVLVIVRIMLVSKSVFMISKHSLDTHTVW